MNDLLKRAQGIADRVVEVAQRGGESARSAFDFIAKRRELAARGVDPCDHKKASGYLEKGRRLYNQKQYLRAEEYFQKAIEYDPGYGLAHYYTGNARYHLEDSEGAVKFWKRAMEVAPDSDVSAKAMKRIMGVKGKFRRVIERMENKNREQA